MDVVGTPIPLHEFQQVNITVEPSLAHILECESQVVIHADKLEALNQPEWDEEVAGNKLILQREQLEVAVGHMRRILEDKVRAREASHSSVVTQCMMVDDERVSDLMYRLFMLLKEGERRRRVLNEEDTTELQGRSYKGLLTLRGDRDAVSGPGEWADEIEWSVSPDGVNPLAAYLAACFYLDCCGGLTKENSDQMAEILSDERTMFPRFPIAPPGSRPTGWRCRDTLTGVGNREVFTMAYNGWLRRRFPQDRRFGAHTTASTAPGMPMISGFCHTWGEQSARPANQVLYALSRYFKVVRVCRNGTLNWAWWGGRRRGGGDGQQLKEMSARHKMEKEMLMEDNTRLGERGDAMQRQMMAQQQQMMMMRRQMMAMEQRMAMMQRGRG